MEYRRWCFPVVLVAALSLIAPAMAMDCARTVSCLGRGSSEGVAVIGDLAVLGAGPIVVTFDITDPAQPQRLGETDLGGTVDPVGAMGDQSLAFVSGYPVARLSVIDPDANGSPQQVSAFDFPDRVWPRDLAVVGSTAWVVTSSLEHGLFAVDLTDPEFPRAGSELQLPGTSRSITAMGNHIFMASSQAGLMIVDVSNPADPTMIGSLELPKAEVVTATTEYAYVATSGGSDGAAIHVVDIAEPSRPVLVSSKPYPYIAWPQGLVIMEDRLVFGFEDLDPSIAAPEGGFIVYDISNPVELVEIGYTPVSAGPRRFEAFGEDIVAADHERGLRVFTESGLTGLTEIARRNVTLDDAFAVTVRGDFAYLGDQGLRIIHLADHTHPVEVGSVELEGNITAVATDETGGGIAVLAWGGDLSLVDVSAPTHPMVRWSGPTEGVDVSVSETVVAVAEGAQGVMLMDATDLGTPVFLARIPTSGPATAVALDSSLAVVGIGASQGAPGALAVVDITDPTNPFLTGQLPISAGVYAVDLADSKAAILTGDSIRLIDITDPTAPAEIGSSDARVGAAEDIAFDGSLVHVASWSGSLYVIDFTNPSGPSVRAGTTWDPFGIVDGGPQGGYGVSLHDGAAVIADGRYGLRVVSIGHCGPAPGPQRGPLIVD